MTEPARDLDFADAGPVRRAFRSLGARPAASRLFARTLHHLDRPVSRLTGGRHTFTSLTTGLTVAVLTTVGARSGRPRSLPLLGFTAAGGFVVIASNYGRPHHPAWYHNLLAQPRAELLLRGQRREVVARLTSGGQRAQLWALALTYYPAWEEYRRRVPDREIGIFLLTDRVPGGPPGATPGTSVKT